VTSERWEVMPKGLVEGCAEGKMRKKRKRRENGDEREK
jgi:hypothetical protein